MTLAESLAKTADLAAGGMAMPRSGSRASTGRRHPGTLRLVDAARIAAEMPAWDALARRASEPNPFYEHWFLLPSQGALGQSRAVSFLRFECDGRLAGLMPMAAASRYYRWPIPNLSNWTHENCFLGAPLVAQGHEHDFWRALFGWADAHAGRALFLHLGHLPLDGALHAAMLEVLSEQGRVHGLVHREERALLSSSLSPEAYFEAALSGKKRKELRRQFARLSELGPVAIERRDDGTGIDAWIDAFLALEASGWKGRAGSALASSQGTAALFRLSLRAAAARGQLERLTLVLDGRPIAMLATLLAPPGAFSFKTAFDEDYARFSPGVLLQRENLALLERDGIDWCDSCAAANHPMIDHLWRERRTIGRYSIAIGGPLRRTLFRRLLAAELGRQTGIPQP